MRIYTYLKCVFKQNVCNGIHKQHRVTYLLPFYRGLVPLHNACSYGHYEVTELLLEHGACVNVADLWKFTPLHEAAAKGKYEICKLLLKVRLCCYIFSILHYSGVYNLTTGRVEHLKCSLELSSLSVALFTCSTVLILRDETGMVMTRWTWSRSVILIRLTYSEVMPLC